MTRHRVLTALTVAGAVAAVLTSTPASGEGKPPRAFDERVVVRDNFFSPRSLTVEPGERVKWSWRGDNRHNVVFKKVPAGASKRSSKTRRDGGWMRSFHKEGQYKYVCTLFAGMRGSVTVKPPPDEGTAGVNAAPHP